MNRIWVARDNDGEINVFVDSPRWLPTLFRGCWRGNEGDHTTPVARGECVEYVRADTVSDSNPWRYPERSELPEKPGLYDASGDFWGDQPQFIAGLFWTGEYWYWSETSDTNEEEDLNRVVYEIRHPDWVLMDKTPVPGRVYAWRERPEPAPELAGEEK